MRGGWGLGAMCGGIYITLCSKCPCYPRVPPLRKHSRACVHACEVRTFSRW
ncbi:unnamed protein product [Ectocarpus sp. 12 AP-2014]